MKIKVIVNPKSGRRVFQKNLETILGRLLLEGVAEQVSVSSTLPRDTRAATCFFSRSSRYPMPRGSLAENSKYRWLTDRSSTAISRPSDTACARP